MHPSWNDTIDRCYSTLDPKYREFLQNSKDYFPQKQAMFNAFNLPKNKTKYILFGQDPYPREHSAIGYAFIDAKVKEIFSSTGLSKEVNRATSLRNFIKMCLFTAGYIDKSASQQQIANLDKSKFINSIEELKDNFLANGVCLLNMALVFETKQRSRYHIKAWRPFVYELLKSLEDESIELILFGSIAKEIEKFGFNYKLHQMPHPYNTSFIQNDRAKELFLPMKLINKRKF